MQTFVVPVTGGLLKRFGWRVDQAVSELARQILHNFTGITALLQRGQRFRRQLLTDLLRLRTVFANGLAGALHAQPGHKFAGFLLDDRFRLHRGSLTLRGLC